jgi:hypothetical protein
MAVADRHGLPVSVCVESASPHEVTLAASTLVQMVIPDAPQNLIGDTAYDSDQLDTQLKFYGIELIAPYRRNRNNKTQDRRRLKTTLENREALCLVAELSPSRRPSITHLINTSAESQMRRGEASQESSPRDVHIG